MAYETLLKRTQEKIEGAKDARKIDGTKGERALPKVYFVAEDEI